MKKLIIALAMLFTFPKWPIATQYWLGLLNYIAITSIAVLGLQVIAGYAGQVSLGHAGLMGVGAFTSAILSSKLGWAFWWAE